MQTLEVYSVSEYVDIVCRTNSDIKESGSNETLLFRGQPDMDKELIPSLARPGINGKSLISEEGSMVKMAKYKLPTVFRRDLEPIELLALLQHHGIPTRLLDVSANALVGLYFACHGGEEFKDNDGEVIVFLSKEMDVSEYHVVNSICNSYKLGGGNSQEDMAIIKEYNERPLFVYAPSYSLRQNIQSGRYILFPNRIEEQNGKLVMTNEIDPVSKDNDSVMLRITIPASVKKRIRRDLRLLGISKELLFLDNADMVCREIRDRFAER